MKIALIGYGKMGKVIEKIAISRNHVIKDIIDISISKGKKISDLVNIDVAIEFTNPQSAIENIVECFKAKIPVVTGTTGWDNEFEIVKQECEVHDGTLFYASNFSLGINIFFEINKKLASLMDSFEQYSVSLSEIHHSQKLDAPSGTAITLAEDLLNLLKRKKSWVNNSSETSESELNIISERINNIPGTHTINYESDVDKIKILHEAKNRNGFGQGAVLAAEFVLKKKGIFGMTDLLKI